MYLNTFVVWKSVLVLVILTEFSGSGFVFAEKNCPLLRLEHGRIRYKFRGRNVRFNCMRGYQLVGAKYTSCMNGKWDANVPICVRHGCIVPSTTRVNGQFIESYRGAVVKIICNPGYNLFGSPSVYCNGYEWNETFPVCKVLNQHPAMSCDFESEDLCGWSQDPMHDYDWRRKSAGSPTAEVGGPPFDKTFEMNGTGHYIHMGSFKSRMENETARLYSPVYSSELSGGSCFIFWYYMSGGNTGTLKVFVKPENLELYNIIPTFWVNGNQGNKWIQGFVPIERTEFPFQIVLEGIRGSGYVSDTAFDDVKIAFGTECAMLEALTSTESTTSVGEFEDQDEENIYFSCRNRCNQTLSSIDKESERNCDCQEECVQAKTCCSDFFDFCQFTDSTTEWLSSSTVDSSGLSYSEPKVSGDKTNDTVDSQKPPKTAFNENPKTNATNTQDAAKVKIITIPVIDAEKEEPPQVTNSTAKVIGIPIIKTEEEVKPQVKNLTVKINEVPIIRGEKVVTKSEVNNSTNQANVTIPTRVVQNKTDVEKKFQLKSNVTKPANSVVNSTNDASKISPERNVTMQKINKTLKGTQPLENSIPVKPLKPPSSSTAAAAAAAAPRKFVKNSKPVESINTVFREKVSVPVFPNELRFHKGKPKEFSGKENPQAIKIDKKEEVREGDFRGIIEAAGICLVVSVVLIILGVVWYRRSRSRKSERDGMVEDSDSIIYDVDFPDIESSEYHSLVSIRPDALRCTQK